MEDAKVEETNKVLEKEGKNVGIRNEKGQFLTRPPFAGSRKGKLNRFTEIKLELVQCWQKSGAKERILAMLKSEDISEFKWAAERIISILPREEHSSLMKEQVVINIFRADGTPISMGKAEVIDVENREKTEEKS